ncbi:MAG: tail fiber domain-containing protein [Bacteroidota bacterium]
MKVINLLTLSVCLLFTSSVLWAQSQTSYGISYQAVARDAEGKALENQELTVKLDLTHPTSEVLLWEETHTVRTNELGLFTLTLGNDQGKRTGGAVDNFIKMPWSEGPLNLEVFIDDGTGSQSMGVSPVEAVPVALYGRDEDADKTNELQGLQLSNGMLALTSNPAVNSVNLGNYLISEVGWQREADTIYFMEGNVGVGTVSPGSLLEVKSKIPGDEPIFQVKNDQGLPVFAVYNEGVEITIPETTAKGTKSGFAVGGYNSGTKLLPTGEYFFQIKPEGANINFLTDENAKGLKSGFAVGGYNSGGKTDPSSYIYMDPYAVPYTVGQVIPIFETTTPKGNCYVGTMAGQLRRGQFNTSVGYQSGYSLSAGFSAGIPFTFYAAKYNTNLGAFSGYSNVSGDYNVNLGYQAGYTNTYSNNVFIGYRAGYSNIGSGNVFIGANAGYEETGSNKLYIANTNTTTPLLYGDFSAATLRLNGNIGINVSGVAGYGLRIIVPSGQTETYALRVYGNISATGSIYASAFVPAKGVEMLDDPLTKLTLLNGVTYEDIDPLAKESGNSRKIGLVAEEVQNVYPELVRKDEEGTLSVNYIGLIPVLIEAVKTQQSEIDLLKEINTSLNEDNQALRNELDEIRAMLNELLQK